MKISTTPARFVFLLGVWMCMSGSGLGVIAQVVVPGEDIEDVSSPEPTGDCFRTANRSCSQDVTLPQDNVDCTDRTCTVILEQVEKKQANGQPFVPPQYVLVNKGVCQTPPGEVPYTHAIAARETPYVAQITAGQGWEKIKGADYDVNCILIKSCACTVAQGQNGDDCEIGEVISEAGVVSGWVVDQDSNSCDFIPPQGGGEEVPTETTGG